MWDSAGAYKNLKYIISDLFLYMVEWGYMVEELLVKSLAGDPESIKAVRDIFSEKINGGPKADQIEKYNKIFEFYSLNNKNSWSQYMLGMMYRFGSLTVKVADEAIGWLRLSVQQRNCFAMCALADMYRLGESMKRDEVGAFELYMCAAEFGNSEGQFRAGRALLSGRGTEVDEKKGVKYLMLAALQNHFEGAAELGLCYMNGVGVLVNEKEGEKWLRKSAEGGCDVGQFHLGDMYFFGKDGMGVRYDKALKWFKVAGESNNPDALCRLGIMYYQGLGVKKNMNVAFNWFERAVVHGNIAAVSYYEQMQKYVDEAKKRKKCVVM
ncbi:MAG: hypothetical protein Harvfovirus28_5 [Harvfovirus sp.]|uniref:Sel1 repeat family protein n=1 Tax=Harvfovirus sp. TaxID=2487768 RepID=A0A3G5A2I3_9VIRU|nr:MAG: hypothetical protein Harvfovirus28_5 [Harvfovirus sp.]